VEEFRVSLCDLRAAAGRLKDPADAIALTAAIDKVAEHISREIPNAGAVGMGDGDGDPLALLGQDLEVLGVSAGGGADADAAAVGFRSGVNVRAAVSRALGATPALLHPSSSEVASSSAAVAAASRPSHGGNSNSIHGSGGVSGGSCSGGGGGGSGGGGGGGTVRSFAQLDSAEHRCCELDRLRADAEAAWAGDLGALRATDEFAPMNGVRVEWRRVTAAWRAAWVDHDLCAAEMARCLEISQQPPEDGAGLLGMDVDGSGGGGGGGGDGGGGGGGGGGKGEANRRTQQGVNRESTWEVDGGAACSARAAAAAATAAAAARALELAPRIEALLRVMSERWHRLVTAYATELRDGRASLRPEHAAAFGYDALEAGAYTRPLFGSTQALYVAEGVHFGVV